jgi:hypothetical protein
MDETSHSSSLVIPYLDTRSIRANALIALFMIDDSAGRKIANDYISCDETLASVANSILQKGNCIPKRRSYWEALLYK